MATYSAAWTVGQTLHGSSSITNGSSATDAINLATLGFYEVHAQIDLDIAAGSPAGNVTIEVFAAADGGSNVDTIPLTSRVVAFTGTGNKKVSIPGIRAPHVSVKVSNATGVAVTYVGRYAGLKQSSA